MELRNGKWYGKRDDGTAEEAGVFHVTSGKLIVSDPCYERGTWCMGTLDDVRNGRWEAEVVRSDEGIMGQRIAELCAWTGRAPASDAAWTRCKFSVGVDSGQAGIFDADHYRVDADAKGYVYRRDGMIDPDDPWYSMCCDLTLTKDVGIVPGGVVSMSGFGDGGYDAFVLKDKGKIVAVRVVFIAEGEDEEGAEETEGAFFDGDEDDDEDDDEDA